ncbi:MAG: dethiobiotin synthase [Chitinophagaceae bacterium]|nr:MAG: dethiobiotin synthase [Chitinophagaceae bacterium]
MIFIAGTGTGVGKTLISSILLVASQGNYWKPVQAGLEPSTDTEWVKLNTGLPESDFIPEKHIFKAPESPHYASKLENTTVELSKLQPPITNQKLIIEGAGGILVPLNETETFLDYIKLYNLPVVLVAGYYLGAINHTLLSIEIIKQSNVKINAVILNGEWKSHASSFLINKYNDLLFFDIPDIKNINKVEIIKAASYLKTQKNWEKILL